MNADLMSQLEQIKRVNLALKQKLQMTQTQDDVEIFPNLKANKSERIFRSPTYHLEAKSK